MRMPLTVLTVGVVVVCLLAPALYGAVVGRWDFDEGVANQVPPQGAPEGALLDTSGAGAPLNMGIFGGAYSDDTPFGTPGLSMQFDGQNDRAFARPGTNLKLENQSVTVETWVKIVGDPMAGNLVSYQPRGTSNDGRGFTLGNGPGAVFHKGTADGSDDYARQQDFLMEVGTWYHIAGAYSAADNRIRAFLNGEEVADVAADPGIVYADKIGFGPIPKTLYLAAVHDAYPTTYDYLPNMQFFVNCKMDRVMIHDVAFDGDDPRLDWYALAPLTDINHDSHVDVVDLLIFVDAFGSTTGDANYDPRCDFNGDDWVDVVDLLMFVDDFGKY